MFSETIFEEESKKQENLKFHVLEQLSASFFCTINKTNLFNGVHNHEKKSALKQQIDSNFR